MMKKFGVIAVVCSMVILSACGKGGEEQAAPADSQAAAVSVVVAPAQKGAIQSEYVYSGKIKSDYDADISSTVSGKVAKTNFEVGDRVNKGDVLFQMDTTDIQNSIHELQAQLASSDASIRSAKTQLDLANGASMQSQIQAVKTGLENAQTSLSTAQSAYDNAKATYDSNKILFDSGIISKSQMDQVQLAYDQSSNALSQANLALEKAQSDYNIIANQMPAENTRKAQDAYNAAVAGKQAVSARIQTAQKTLQDATVTSPISGIVTAKNATAGTLLAQSSPAYTIINMDKVKADVNISEQIINQLSLGEELDIYVKTVSDAPRKGTVVTINPDAIKSGTFNVELELENTDGLLKSGMFAEVHFVKERKEDVVVVQRDVVISNDTESYVYIEQSGAVKKSVVELGIDNGDYVEIVSGLQAGDNVVTKGQSYLSDGDKVKIASSETKGE